MRTERSVAMVYCEFQRHRVAETVRVSGGPSVCLECSIGEELGRARRLRRDLPRV